MISDRKERDSNDIKNQANQSDGNRRIQWIDVAKGIGIYAIWIGHMGSVAGMSYEYVFQWHVNLFFFLSGCVENYNKRTGINNIIHKYKSLLIPFYIFAIQSIIVDILYSNSVGRHYIEYWLKVVLKGGVRNQFMAVSLWFLTGLFAVEVLFIIFRYLFKNNKVLLLGGTVILFLLSIFVIKPNPKWLYNFDSAFYYLIFYVIGYFVFPYLLKLINRRIWFNLVGIASCLYNVLIFMRKDGLPMPGTSYAAYYGVGGGIRAFAGIAAFIYVSVIFEDLEFFKDFGKNSLYLCGLEYIWKTICSEILYFFGITIPTGEGYALGYLLYIFILMWICNNYVVPVEKYIIDSVVKWLKKSFGKGRNGII